MIDVSCKAYSIPILTSKKGNWGVSLFIIALTHTHKKSSGGSGGGGGSGSGSGTS